MPDPALAQHQGLPVAGYHPQSDDKVALVNLHKRIEERILRILDDLAATDAGPDAIDKRWLAIGRSHIEQGFMAINRSIFQPERINLEDDA